MKNTRTLVEGAFMLSIFIVLLLMAVYVPVIMLIAQFFLVLPFLLYSAKYPMKYAALLFVGAVLVTFVIGSLGAVPLAFLYGTTGLMMGYGVRKKKSKGNILLTSSIVFLINILIIFVVIAQFFNLNLIDEFFNVLQSSTDQYLDIMKSMGQVADEKFQEQMEAMILLYKTVLPSLVVGTSFVTVLLLMAVNFPILKRLGIDVPKFQPFRMLKLPKAILYYYLITLIASIFIKVDVGTYWYTALVNAAYILQALLVIQGLSLVFYYSHMKKWTVAIPIVAIILAVLLPIFLTIIRLLGIIDLGFNLRDRLNKKNDE